MNADIYTPDRWQILKLSKPGHSPHHRLLSGWYGGFAGSDEWRLNSGIVVCEEIQNYYQIVGVSGTKYHCKKSAQGTSSLMRSVITKLELESFVVTLVDVKEYITWVTQSQ